MFFNLVKCNFDDGKLCSFTNDQNDEFDWTINSGSTSSFDTGPSQDVSGTGKLYSYFHFLSQIYQMDYKIWRAPSTELLSNPVDQSIMLL